jgi:pimeloyl-ACP methyl ester carboxylesterase
MNRWMNRTTRCLIAVGALCVLAQGARAEGIVGTSFPAGFPTLQDASLAKPLIGFGAAGPVMRTPVIFVHGNNDTPFPTTCNPFFGKMHAVAQYLADHGYAPSELWGLGYQGDQCDLLADQTHRSATAHTAAANVDDLRRFVHAVLDFTGAREVDIVGHSLGVVVAREWLRQDRGAKRQVRRLVAIDGPNHGIINCSPSPANYWQLPALGGFTPSSAICVELGSPDTPFLQRLNRHEAPRGVRTLVIRNADTSFVYFPIQDGVLVPVPAQDSFGKATDFSGSARLKDVRELNLTGQGVHDPILGTTHLGILNSPDTWAATLRFLRRHDDDRDGDRDDARDDDRDAERD